MKKWKLILITGGLILSCAGCGEKDDINVLVSSNDSIESAESNDADEDAAVNGAAEEEVETKNEAAADLDSKTVQGDTAAFAEQIKMAVADRDLAALADLCSYPLAVDGEVIENKDSFMELDEGIIFTDERCAVIEAVDTSVLEDTMAGIIMGEGTPNIVFKSVDGALGITGIN